MLFLIDQKDLFVALPGAALRSFRGDPYRLLGATPPQHPGSTGRIHTAPVVDTKTGAIHPLQRASYFPSVCNLAWMDEDEWKSVLLEDGCPREAADDLIAQAIDLLTKKGY